jgi:ATP-dependent Clp protease ATP-binding subunit ClpA
VLTQEALNQYHTPEMPLSLVLFDEIEKASDALWQLLLGILDKASLTLGDNRKVSFAQALIFMTSNLGASEMQRLLQPGFGFAPITCVDVSEKLTCVATEAARRKFSPEFFNRLDHVVVFHPLDRTQLERILDLELELVRQRLMRTAGTQTAFTFRCTTEARDFLLAEGTDLKYGARHLKRAIERHVVHPMANLIATRQISAQDNVVIDVAAEHGALVFSREHAAAARAGRGWGRREAA